MTTTPWQRRVLLGGVLLATIAAALWENGSEPMTVALAQGERVSRAALARQPDTQLPELEIDRLERQTPHDPVTDAFETRSWAPPPPPPVKTAPPPPQAPPLPYTYIGKMIEDGQIVVFVAKQQRNYVVRSGDKLDNVYQVDEIKPTVMLLTYLPLNIQQSLAIGRTN